jgi:hypothetical protein
MPSQGTVPILTLDCVLLKDKSLVFALGVGPKINSEACLWVLPRHTYPSKSLIKEPPSTFPNMVPVERDTLSPEPVVYSFIYLYPSESPVKEPSHVSGENIWTPYLYPRGQKAYIQWGVVWFPKGIVYDTAITTPVPCSLQHHAFHLGWGRPEPH